jgi:hypothetical protein
MTPFGRSPGVRQAAVFVLVAGAVLGLPAAVAAADEDLLRLVPDDVGFCLVIRDLRGQSAAVAESPFARQFRASAFGQRILAAPEMKKLTEADAALRKNLDISWAELRDDILGDRLVLAYRPGPPGKPEQEQGLFLTRARDAKRLSQLIERLNKAQRTSGELKKLDELHYAGQTYYRRTDKKGESYYFQNGPVVVFSTREAILRQAIDRAGKALAAGKSRIVADLHRLGADKGLAALWLNPRAFEPDLQAKAAQARGGEADFLKTLLAYWKAVDGIVLSAAVEKDGVAVSLTVAVDQNQALPGGRRLFTTEPQTSELWTRFPDNALVAVAGQVDAAGLTEFVGDFVGSDVRTAVRGAEKQAANILGKDPAKDVLPALGPDWGFCMVAPAPQEKAWFPHIVWVLRVRPGNGKPPVDQAVLNALNSIAFLGVLGFNNEHPDAPARIEVDVQDKIDVKYVINDKLFPPGFRPAYALKDGYLVLASSPEAIRRFAPVRSPLPAGESVPLLRVSLRDWREYLRQRKEALAEHMARDKEISTEEAARRIDRLVDGLELFDRVEVSERLLRPGQLSVTVRLRTATPLLAAR